jgi:hypothetical protein
LTTVLVRMPAYFAEHLARVLTSWTTIGELVSKLSYDESRMSEALIFAADAANEHDESSPELLLNRVRDLLAEFRMGVQRSDQDASGPAD